MKLEELNEEMKSANEIIVNWKKSSDDLEELPKAIYEALEENRKAVIKYLTELEK